MAFLQSWVGYAEENFEGQQYILEEGEYPHHSDWGGSEGRLLSLRPVMTVRPRTLFLLSDILKDSSFSSIIVSRTYCLLV